MHTLNKKKAPGEEREIGRKKMSYYCISKENEILQRGVDDWHASILSAFTFFTLKMHTPNWP